MSKTRKWATLAASAIAIGALTFLVGRAWAGGIPANGALQVQVDATHNFAFAPSLSKTFVIDHPGDQTKYLVHATLEGPESAVYYRGSSRLHRGIAEIALPAYFETEARPEGRTVLLTPTFESTSEPISPLAATRVRRGAFLVRAIDKSNLQQAFDWEVKAVRADVPPSSWNPAATKSWCTAKVLTSTSRRGWREQGTVLGNSVLIAGNRGPGNRGRRSETRF